MAREKKPVHRVQMTEGKRNIIHQLLEEYDIQSDEVYPILYIDAIHYSVRDNGVIQKLAAYVILGINAKGKKEVLTISIGENESSKYWLSVLNELKNRGVMVYK